MKNHLKISKVIINILLFVVVFMLKSFYCYAIELPEKVEPIKDWEITFNQPIDIYSIYNNNIVVKDSNNKIVEDIEVVMSQSGQTVKVKAPQNGYIREKVYTLIISNKVRSLNGKYLKLERKKQFKIKSIRDEVVPDEPEIPEVDKSKHSIRGKEDLTAEQMAEFVLNHNPNPKISIDIHKLANIFLEEGAAEGIRGDIAFCQSIKETGYFKYGGQVLPEQNNYAGIGAVNNSPVGKGAWFKDVREGVRAQIQHLKGYATKEVLKNECVDPRYHILKQVGLLGVAPNWEDLNGRWAVPGNNYGEEIIQIYKKVKKYKIRKLS